MPKRTNLLPLYKVNTFISDDITVVNMLIKKDQVIVLLTTIFQKNFNFFLTLNKFFNKC